MLLVVLKFIVERDLVKYCVCSGSYKCIELQL